MSRLLNKSAAHTLRYFRRAHERDPECFCLPDENTPRGRMGDLLSQGVVERAPPPNTDLFRITAAGLSALGSWS